jgi:hypothetical protein
MAATNAAWKEALLTAAPVVFRDAQMSVIALRCATTVMYVTTSLYVSKLP